MKSYDEIINNIVESLQEKQDLDKNRTPTLNNIHDVLLEKLPKIKNFDNIRVIISKNLKLKIEFKWNNETLIKSILQDIQTSNK